MIDDWVGFAGFSVAFAVGVWIGYQMRPYVEAGMSIMNYKLESYKEEEKSEAKYNDGKSGDLRTG